MPTSQKKIRDFLPKHLAERARFVATDDGVSDGQFVLYWLHHAMRAHENPALDVAISLSNRLALPLLVYQGLPETYPFASDRHHRFILDGICDLQRQFERRGIQYAIHLERRNQHDPQLQYLTNRAAVVVTDEMSVQPIRGWIDKLGSIAETTVLAVDTACVVPVQVVGRAYDRAFQFRKATISEYQHRISREWSEIEIQHGNAEIELLFSSPVLTEQTIGSLISKCDIDHSIGPVPHTLGGSAAGYARWNQFKRDGLKAYARHRNDPLADATSRLSPYLHFGMVSPLRIARDAAAMQSAGSEKFLDELLIWRELAYCFCFFNRDHDSLNAIPEWARQTLADHRSDRRPQIYSWETLARGQTGDKLWDAAQRSLLMHGELHNNVRMTWGKALLNWTPDAETALAMMLDLNHRYALDGRDPASYGGILWCLGQFDRPFKPPRPIFGMVRSRSTREHSQRLDTDLYLQQTTRALTGTEVRVAVVGAGMSGLICARTLSDHGLDVTVFEKSRGIGGRMSTRRALEGMQFDHGAQYFTVRDQRFQRYVDSWQLDGIVQPWPGRICALSNGKAQWKEKQTRRFVGIPTMNAVCRHLADQLPVTFDTLVAPPERRNGYWYIADCEGRGLGNFDYLVISAPAPQSAELLSAAPNLQAAAAEVRMGGCWAVMLGFDEALDLPYDGAFVGDSPLSWIARNNSKPERQSGGECWILHASPEWTAKHLHADPEAVLSPLIDAFWKATDAPAKPAIHQGSHRWSYAIPIDPLEQPNLFDADLRVGACGDWCGGPRVEGAFLSGMSMAGRLLTHVLEPTAEP